MHGYHKQLYGIIIAFNRKKSKQHRNGIFPVTTPQYCVYFHNRHSRGIMQSQGRKFQRNQHLIATSKGESIMKKLIASAASLTLAATILAGSASAASPLDFLKEFSWKNLFCQSQQAEQSQTEKALALINTFATGDTKTARSLLADGYIQHNLAYGTGADAFVGSVEYLASAPVKTTVQNIRAFEDGDKVFLQTIYNFAGAGEQVAFDIFPL
jgi:predicted SnoaL-like aldol condensation-catalyzing enzyme